ncbi:hypothetical protein GCM10010321_02360 [Streptomyces chartreusis]|nr:hypothetical protein GCM10010321_02360 [Streptomyces chartreusis]
MTGAGAARRGRGAGGVPGDVGRVRADGGQAQNHDGHGEHGGRRAPSWGSRLVSSHTGSLPTEARAPDGGGEGGSFLTEWG